MARQQYERHHKPDPNPEVPHDLAYVCNPKVFENKYDFALGAPNGPPFTIFTGRYGSIPPQEHYSKLPSHRQGTGGVLAGYAGHVPRARDKVGASALGGANSGEVKKKELEQTFRKYGVEPPQYVSEQRSAGNVPITDPRLHGRGVKTGFGGHIPTSKESIGRSVFTLESASKGTRKFDMSVGDRLNSEDYSAASIASLDEFSKASLDAENL